MWGIFRTFAVLAVLLSAVQASASEDVADTLKRIEAQGLSGLKPARIEQLLSAPAPP